jgi:ubiquitin-activating enzyme E1
MFLIFFAWSTYVHEPLQAVVLCNATLEKQLEINDWTHANGVSFIATETRGLFGYENCYCLVSRLVSYHDSSVFNDFGPNFTCVDTNGQPALSGMIAAIANVSTMNTPGHIPY